MKRLLFLTALSISVTQFFIIHTAYQAVNDQAPMPYGNLITTLQEELKKPEYRKNILPHDFSYLVDLLHHGRDSGQPRDYIRSVFKLFGNLLKGAEYVNPYAFSSLLDELPHHLRTYFTAQKARAYLKNTALYDANMFDRFKETVNNMLYIKFSSEYESFKQDPEQFLTNLSNEIVGIAQEEVSIEQLRQGIIRFCEIGLGKIIWSPYDKEKTWESVKTISNQLATLIEYNILDDVNDLDDLYWTLINRYCHFLDLMGIDMPTTFYQHVKNDLSSQELLLFELEEQDATIVEAKIQYFTRTLLEAETKCRAYQKGILTRS